MHSLAHVVVDEPQGFASSVPARWETTSPDVAVVRLHGRNADTWQLKGAGSSAERFRYLYGEDKLRAIEGRVRTLAAVTSKIHVLFNNSWQVYAHRNARDLVGLMEAG